MKKFNYLLLGLAGLTMASCSQDDLLNGGKGDGNYNLVVNLPSDMATRAYTAGIAADNLSVAVYDVDGNLVETRDDLNFGGKISTVVSLNLVAGQSYNIALFAQSPNSTEVYVFDAANKVIDVNYDKMGYTANNADDYDCFYKLQPTGVVGTEAITETVLLTRPIAKVNWGTDDLDASSVKTAFTETDSEGNVTYYLTTNFKTTAYNQFSLLGNDVVEDATTEVTLQGWAMPTGWNFPVGAGEDNNATDDDAYQYIAMQYLLAPVASTTYDFYLTADNSTKPNVTTVQNDLIVTNAPVQANYQTNIYGSLLTDNVNITVEKDPVWGGQFDWPMGEPYEGLDGLYFDQASKTYTITSEQGLANFITEIADKFNHEQGQYSLRGYTIRLGNDLDLSKINFTPFASGGADFDGQGHTISNLNVKGTEAVGFIIRGVDGTIKNLTFDNANVTGGPAFCGIVMAEGTGAKFENVTIKNSKITSLPSGTGWQKYQNQVGFITGYTESSVSITNCTIENCTMNAYTNAGGLIGYINNVSGTATITGNTLTDVTILVNLTTNPGEFSAATNVGEIYGVNTKEASNSNFSNNNADVTILTLTNNGYSASSFKDLQAIAGLGSAPLYNKTITITQDIDLGGAVIEPLDFGAQSSDYNNSIIDGGNFTISNFTVQSSEDTKGHNGLIANFHGQIKNLTVDNMTINDNVDGNIGVIGYLVGTAENITVKNSKFISTDANVGAIAGAIEDTGSVKGCVVEGCTLSGRSRVGGLVGGLLGGAAKLNFSDCNISNTTISTTDTVDKYGPTVAGSYLGTIISSGSTVTYGSDCGVGTGVVVNGETVTTPGNTSTTD